MDRSQAFGASKRIPRHVELMIGRAMAEKIRLRGRVPESKLLRAEYSGPRVNAKNAKILQTLRVIVRRDGITTQEIADLICMSPQATGTYMAALEADGLITIKLVQFRIGVRRKACSATLKGREHLAA